MPEKQIMPTSTLPREYGLHISGRVISPVFLPWRHLLTMDALEIEGILMTCGDGDPKGYIGRCKGVLLADIINISQADIRDHNDTKKMVVVAAADDGYKAVFSWQEIFNTPNGEGIIVLLEKDGELLGDGHGGVDLLSSRDYFTGPRYVRNLQSLQIDIVE